MREKRIFFEVIKYYLILLFCMLSWRKFGEYKQLMIIYCSVFILLFALIKFKSKHNILKEIQSNKALILLGVLFLLSNFWSIEKNATLFNSSLMMIIVILCIFLSSIYSREEFCDILIKYYILSICVTVFLFIFFKDSAMMDYDSGVALKGVYTHKNILARNMVIAIILFFNKEHICKNKLNKWIFYILIFLAFILIILSKSTAGLIYAIAFVIFSIIINKTYIDNIIAKITYMIILIFNIFIIWISRPETDLILSSYTIFNKNLTFTGRTAIWNYAIEHIKLRPILGYGYHGFWENDYIKDGFYSMYKFIPPHAHNGYLDCILSGGIILLVILLYITYVNINCNSKDLYSNSSFLIMIFILLINLTEESFFQGGTVIFPIIIFFNYMKSCKKNDIESS